MNAPWSGDRRRCRRARRADHTLENFSNFELPADDFTRMNRIDAWLCWVPNLLVAEWLIRRRRRNKRIESRKRQAA